MMPFIVVLLQNFAYAKINELEFRLQQKNQSNLMMM